MSETPAEYRQAAQPLPPRPGINAAAMGATPVTNGLFVELLNTQYTQNGDDQGGYRYVNIHNPAQPIKRDADSGMYHVAPALAGHPVVGVTWIGAYLFARMLGGRLPTIAEWEYAATCGDDRRYPWGDESPTPDLANYGEYYGGTVAVMTFQPNDWGLFEMAGNVADWCASEGDSITRWNVTHEYPAKGGAWNKLPAQLACRFTRRKWGRIGTVGIGFRVIYD